MLQSTAASAPQLDWTSILLLMSLSGMFGGILDVLGIIDIRRLVLPDPEGAGPIIVSTKRFVAALILGGIGGIGGAFAMLFVIVAAAKLDTTDTPINRLLLCSLGVVSGFLGFRVLRGVARGVERQIQESEARLEAKTEGRLRKAENEVKNKVDYIDTILTGLKAAESETLPSVLLKAASRLENLRKQEPLDREVTMILGRVYRKLARYDRAVEVLTELYNRIKNSDRHQDVADLLYNRACYSNLMADKLQDGEQKEGLKKKVYEDLGESIRLSPENRKDALNDRDFQTIWNEERFQQLTT